MERERLMKECKFNWNLHWKQKICKRHAFYILVFLANSLQNEGPETSTK